MRRVNSSRFSVQKEFLVLYTLIFLFAIIVIFGRLLFSGDKYGLDYNVYQPDGICYTKMAANFGNIDLDQIGSEIARSYEGISAEEVKLLDCNSVKARVLYPLMSVPFLKLFGLEGMLVIPSLCYLLSLILLLLGLRHFEVSIHSTALIAFFVLISTTFSRWYIANLVDSLLITLTWFLTYYILTRDPIKHIRGILLTISIVCAMALTKRSLHLVLICALVYFIFIFRSRKKESVNHFVYRILIVFVTAPVIVDYLVELFMGRQNGLKTLMDVQNCLNGKSNALCETSFGSNGSPQTPSDTLPITEISSKFDVFLDSILQSIYISVRYLYVSIAQVFVVDLPLAIVFVFWAFCVAKFYRNLNLLNTFALFSPVFIALIASLNGTLGLNFRFELAFFYPIFLALAKVIDELIIKPTKSD